MGRQLSMVDGTLQSVAVPLGEARLLLMGLLPLLSKNGRGGPRKRLWTWRPTTNNLVPRAPPTAAFDVTCCFSWVRISQWVLSPQPPEEGMTR